MEKISLALVMSAQKLRPYFLAYKIVVPTDMPIKHMLQCLDSTAWYIIWAIELSEFDINYENRTTYKGQVLADFFAEFARPVQEAGVWRI